MGVEADAASNPPPTSPRVPGARLALAMLLTINLFNYIDRQVLAAVETDIAAELLPDDPDQLEKMGRLPMAFMVTYMLAAPIFGWLADRVSRWHLIGIGVILWSLASGASGWYWPVAHAYLLLLLTRCFVGVGEAAYGPSAPTVIADLFPIDVRAKVFSWFYLAIPVGSALGYVLGGIVKNALGWRWAFFLVLPPGVLLGLACFLLPDPPRGHADKTRSRRARFRDFQTFLTTPSYILDTLGMTAMTFAMGAIAYYMPRFIVKDRAAGPVLGQDPVLFFGIVTASAGLIATLTGGILGDRLRARWSGSYFIVSAIGMILGFVSVLFVLYTPFPYAWFAVFAAVFFLFLNTSPTNTILANVTHPSIRANAFAFNILIIHLFGDAVSPWLVGVIADKTNLQSGFLAVSAMILVGAAFWFAGAWFLARDTELAPTRLGE